MLHTTMSKASNDEEESAPASVSAPTRGAKGKGKAPTRGKRKADNVELAGQSPTKKSVVIENDGDIMETDE